MFKLSERRFVHYCVLYCVQIYCEVIPKRHAVSQANAELETATAKLSAVQKKLAVSAVLLLFLLESLSLKAGLF